METPNGTEEFKKFGKFVKKCGYGTCIDQMSSRTKAKGESTNYVNDVQAWTGVMLDEGVSSCIIMLQVFMD